MNEANNWVYIEKDFDYRPNAMSLLAFKAGNHILVTKAAADAIVEAGVGRRTEHEAQTGDTKDGTQPVRLKGKLHDPKTGAQVKEPETVKVDRLQG